MKVKSLKYSWHKRSLSVFILSLFGFLVVNLAVAAWTPPSNDPPNSNTLEPLDISNRAQTKQGNVGIGATASALYKLNVGGSINASTSLCINDDCYTDLDRLWNLTINGTDMFNASLGKVGIGLASPGAQLDVATNNQTADGDILLRVSKRLPSDITSEVFSVLGSGVTNVRQLHIHNMYGGSFEGWRQYQDESSGNYNMAYIYEGLDGKPNYKNIITAIPFNPVDEIGDPREGNVGINYSAPVESLQVAGKSSEAGAIAISPGLSNSGYGFYRTGILKFLSNDNESSDFWSGIEGYRNGYSDDTELRFYTEENNDGNGGPTQKMVIKGNGSVGIGKDPVSGLLDVAGSINADGAIMSGAGISADGTISAGGSLIGDDLTTTGDITSTGGKVNATEFCISGNCTTSWSSNQFWSAAANGIQYTAGGVGIGSAPLNPVTDAYVNIGKTDTSLSTRLRITDTDGSGSASNNPELQLKYGTNAGDHWGLYVNRSNDNNLVFWNGTNKFALTSAGNLGVGITTSAGASDKITVSDSQYPSMMLKNDNNSLLGQLSLATGAGFYSNVAVAGDMVLRSSTAGVVISARSAVGNISFATGAGVGESSKMVIANNGNVGVGITNPNSRLHSYNSTADGTTPGRTNIIDVLTLETANTAAAPYRGFGQGIEFRGRTYSNATVRTLGRIATVLTDDSVTNTGSSIVFQNVADSSTVTAPVERMRIDYNGNVGIGINNPTYKLDVSGGGLRVAAGAAIAAILNSTADIQLTLTSSDLWTGIGFNDSGAIDDYLWYNGTNGTFAFGGGGSNVAGKKLHVDGGMSVGANFDATTVPTNGLYVEGNIYGATRVQGGLAQMQTSGGYATFGSNAASTNIRINTDANGTGANGITIINGGNVGIGTTTPATLLTVAGAGAVSRVYNTTNNYSVDFGFPSNAAGEPSLSMYTSGVTLGRVVQRQNSTKNVYLGDIDANGGKVIIRSNAVDTLTVSSGDISVNGVINTSSSSNEGGAISIKNPSKTGALQANRWAIYNMTAGYTDSLQFWNYNDSNNFGSRLTLMDDGKVGIGINPTLNKFAVSDGSSGPIIGLYGLTTQYRGLTVYNTSNVEQWFYGPNSSNNFVIRRNGNSDALTVNLSDGKVTVAGTLSANKIDFAQADPPYKINNKTYATYALNMIGSKEEYAAVLTLTKKSNEYVATINFENQEEGSDLWLFSKVTNLNKVFDKLIVQLTPNFSGRVWYEKINDNKIIVHALPEGGKNKNSLEVSLRLTAPRYDYQKWANTREPSDVANDLDEFYKNE